MIVIRIATTASLNASSLPVLMRAPSVVAPACAGSHHLVEAFPAHLVPELRLARPPDDRTLRHLKRAEQLVVAVDEEHDVFLAEAAPRDLELHVVSHRSPPMAG